MCTALIVALALVQLCYQQLHLFPHHYEGGGDWVPLSTCRAGALITRDGFSLPGVDV